ncbi:MAG: outer membrane beta-barrel protein [Deltaproteobacteria bacterium]|nr:outer membrane beta-barrel protein [Deltaproteobacteria bacterium]
MRKTLLSLAVFAVSIFFYSSAEAIVHVEGRYWFTSLNSKVKATETSLIGTEIDLADTLGMSKSKDFWEARIDLNLGDHHLMYSYMPLSWSGQKTITQSVNFAGTTYAANAQVDSKLDIIYQRVGYRYNIIDRIGNQLGVIFDVKILDIKTNLKTTAVDESYSVTVPIPTIGLGAQVGLPFLLSFGGEITGIAYGGNQLIDWEAYINFNPVPFTTISGGYRTFGLNVKDKDNKVDFSLAGPFLMVNVGF